MTPDNSHNRIPRVGYGCSMLMSRLDRKLSLRLLETAFDAGITYFDTARLYGYGEAESVLGDLLSSKRGRIVIATKAGILPPKPSRLMSAAKTAARAVVTLSPKLKPYFRRKGESMVEPGRFDLPTISNSLETSLRELRADCVDNFLLHECQPQDLKDTALLDYLLRVQKAGKVRRFGIATTFDAAVAAAETHPEYGQVVQFPSNAWNRNRDRVKEKADQIIVTHSILGRNVSALHGWLRDNPDRLQLWNEELGVDCGDMTALGGIFLSYALHSNSNGVTLFSSVSETRIRSNAAVALKLAGGSTRAVKLAKLVDSLPALEIVSTV